MNPTFDTETWENVIVAGGIVLMAFLWLWMTMEIRANRRAKNENTAAVKVNTEIVKLWLLAFDAARKSGTVYPACPEPENLNDVVLK
jgi:hypothetical protein